MAIRRGFDLDADPHRSSRPCTRYRSLLPLAPETAPADVDALRCSPS